MKYKILTYYDDKLIVYYILYKGNMFVGSALCHADDSEYYNKFFGISLAKMRAEVKLYEYKRKEANKKADILRVALRAMTQQEQASIGGKRLARQIAEAKEETENYKKLKQETEEDIKRYIGHKEAFNIWYRKHKKKDKNQ